MGSLHRLAACAFTLVFAAPLAAQSGGVNVTAPPPIAPLDSATEDAAIRRVIQDYFDGIVKYDTIALKRAFHPQAVITASFPNGEYRRGFAEWSRFVERGAPPANPQEYVNVIEQVERTGTAAVVRTRLTWPQVIYVDYLSLLRVDGQWKIVDKIWHQQRRSP